KLLRRQALRLERRAGQRPSGRADALTQSGKPVARAAKSAHQVVGKLDIVEDHVVVDRGIAEQHVDQLPGVVADRCGGERDAHRECPGAQVAQLAHATDDLGVHVGVVDGVERHLDALLDRDGAGAIGDRLRVAADMIGRFYDRLHGARTSRSCAKSTSKSGIPGNQARGSATAARWRRSCARPQKGGGVLACFSAGQGPVMPTRSSRPGGAGGSSGIQRRMQSAATMAIRIAATMPSQSTNTARRLSRMAADTATIAGASDTTANRRSTPLWRIAGTIGRSLSLKW